MLKTTYPRILKTSFSINQNTTTKKLIPEQPQDNVIHCVNLYLTYNCDTLSLDQQSSVMLLNLPCTLVLCQLSSYTQAAPKHWYVPCNCRSKINVLDI